MKLVRLNKAFTPYDNIFKYVETLDDNVNAIVIALDSLIHKDKSEFVQHYKESALRLTEKGYSDLYKPNVIALYTLLEAAVRDLITALFKEYKTTLDKVKEVQKIKISVIEFETLTEHERYDYLYSEYERDVVKGEKYGVSRFKKLLDPLGINIIVEDENEKVILELAQIRNCIIHRNAIVDKKLLTECPWLKSDYKIGDEIIIMQKHFKRYIHSVIVFSSDLEEAVREYITS
jgi:hypothetical protein